VFTFGDMRERVWFYARRDGRIYFRDPGDCWPLGPLYLFEAEGKRWALLGDLRIEVSEAQSLELIRLAHDRKDN